MHVGACAIRNGTCHLADGVMWREVSSTYITRAQITRANIDFNGGGSRLVHCRDRLADASGEDLGRGHLHEQLRGRLPVPPALGLGLGSEDLGLGLK